MSWGHIVASIRIPSLACFFFSWWLMMNTAHSLWFSTAGVSSWSCMFSLGTLSYDETEFSSPINRSWEIKWPYSLLQLCHSTHPSGNCSQFHCSHSRPDGEICKTQGQLNSRAEQLLLSCCAWQDRFCLSSSPCLTDKDHVAHFPWGLAPNSRSSTHSMAIVDWVNYTGKKNSHSSGS